MSADDESVGLSVVEEDSSSETSGYLPDDPAVQMRINIVVAWMMHEIQLLTSNRFFGKAVTNNLKTLMGKFERKLEQQGLGPDVVGTVAQQIFYRVRELLNDKRGRA